MAITRYMNAAELPAESEPANTTYFSSANKHLDSANQALSAVDPNNQHLHIDNLTHQDSGFELSNQERYALFDSQGMSRDFIRRHIRQERKSFTVAEQHQLALIASRHMLAEIQQRNAQHVALYFSYDGELATEKLIEALWHIGVKTYLPLIHPFSPGHLLFCHYHRDSVLIKNKFGISEPKLNVQDIIPTPKLDMIITPLVAFDGNCNRMGMGGGYYDRTLKNTVNNKPLAVGFAHDCQQVSHLPIERWDIPLPLVITPTRRLAKAGV
jgi:5-formyltetrahydrofolate cyclo-ligase